MRTLPAALPVSILGYRENPIFNQNPNVRLIVAHLFYMNADRIFTHTKNHKVHIRYQIVSKNPL